MIAADLILLVRALQAAEMATSSLRTSSAVAIPHQYIWPRVCAQALPHAAAAAVPVQERVFEEEAVGL